MLAIFIMRIQCNYHADLLNKILHTCMDMMVMYMYGTLHHVCKCRIMPCSRRTHMPHTHTLSLSFAGPLTAGLHAIQVGLVVVDPHTLAAIHDAGEKIGCAWVCGEEEC